MGAVVQTSVGAVFFGELQPVGRPCRISSRRMAYCRRDLNLSLISRERDQEGVAEMKHYGWRIAPIPCLLVPLREVEEGRWEEGDF